MRPRAVRSLRIVLRIALFEQGSQPVRDDLALSRSVTASGCKPAPARTSIASSISPAERATKRVLRAAFRLFRAERCKRMAPSMFSNALMTLRNAATASTWVVSRWMPPPICRPKGVVERIAIIECDRAFEGGDGIVVKERGRVGGLDQRRDVELPSPKPSCGFGLGVFSEPAVGGHGFARQARRRVQEGLDPNLYADVRPVAGAEVALRPGVHVAQIALPEGIVEEDVLPATGDRPLERQRQDQNQVCRPTIAGMPARRPAPPRSAAGSPRRARVATSW